MGENVTKTADAYHSVVGKKWHLQSERGKENKTNKKGEKQLQMATGEESEWVLYWQCTTLHVAHWLDSAASSFGICTVCLRKPSGWTGCVDHYKKIIWSFAPCLACYGWYRMMLLMLLRPLRYKGRKIPGGDTGVAPDMELLLGCPVRPISPFPVWHPASPPGKTPSNCQQTSPVSEKFVHAPGKRVLRVNRV